ncbi:YbdK family carboxylate-amine ligase [Crystallibacter degradans]|uniref:YbdK family carboxylate-amine ligase n=1 Tax=Crystallibacter degradans TaxID=2726743 RepID=UPI00197BC74A|nr:YbdK family carboxylate-amine ligase [Arthrobacter sp. SF27]
MRTFGVEEELLLVDPGSGMAVPVARQVMDLYARSGVAGMAPEAGVRAFVQEQIETATAVHTTLHGLAEDILAGRARADVLAPQVEATAIALGTAPLPAELHTVRLPRFEAIRNQLGLTAVQQLTCACHVHVGIESPEEGVAVLDRIRVWLPVLAALSANSPFWDGTDTGYASFRTQLWGRWPTTDPTEIFGSADAYRRLVRDLLATGVRLDEGMVYFDARLSRTYPTVAIRGLRRLSQRQRLCPYRRPGPRAGLDGSKAMAVRTAAACDPRSPAETCRLAGQQARHRSRTPPSSGCAAFSSGRHHRITAQPTLPALADIGDDAWAKTSFGISSTGAPVPDSSGMPIRARGPQQAWWPKH